MKYIEFHYRYGGAYRTVHLNLIPTEPLARIKWVLKFLFSKQLEAQANKRFYMLPPTSTLPAGYIRLDPWEGEYLFMLASRAQKSIVEVGRFHGGSSFLFSCANSEAPIYSVDIAPQDDDKLRGFLTKYNVGNNLQLIVGDSQKTEYPEISDIDLLFIDGDHSYQGCTNDLENWYPKVMPGGHIVLHDSYFGSEVQPAAIDFLQRHDVQVVRPPYIISSHWRLPPGSLAHFIKKG